ncbi:MAG: zinc-ribbon domain-containing protein [Bryobacterales bacterium]
MPYCIHCGHEVSGVDRFCRKCGKPQPSRQGVPPTIAQGLSPRGASMLCYIPWLGWIAAIYVLVSDTFRNNRTVRFHAFQGLYIFVGWMLAHWVLGLWLRVLSFRGDGIATLIELFLLGVWVFMLIKTSNNQRFELPLVGELAERSL